MDTNKTIEGPNPSGLCLCGCGKRTSLASQDDKQRGNVKGKPVRYIKGHWTKHHSTMSPIPDITGQRFGLLVANYRVGFSRDNKQLWSCLCDCGQTKIANRVRLMNGKSRSCGCLRKETNKTHGKSYTPEFKLLTGAKARSRQKQLPFNLTIEDIVIPTYCPILGIKLESQLGRCGANSPTLDRIVPKLGYVRGNIAVISQRANTVKSDATPEQIHLVADWLDVQYENMRQ